MPHTTRMIQWKNSDFTLDLDFTWNKSQIARYQDSAVYLATDNLETKLQSDSLLVNAKDTVVSLARKPIKLIADD